MKIKTVRNRAMAMLGLLILVGAVLVIAGTIIYMLIKLCQRVFPPTATEPAQTNVVATVEMVRADQLTNAMTGFTPASVPLIEYGIEVQRSTNLNDWEPILQAGPDYQFQFSDDTNAPADRAFYRLRYFPR